MKEKSKKVICISIIIILIIILIFLFQKIRKELLYKKNFENSVISFAENNQKTIFTINKIVFFSSSDSKNKSSSPTNFTIENLYAYTDIALFIDNNSEENNFENTLKKLKITNIKFTKEPTVGKANLYYKPIDNFSKSELKENNIIDKELEFEITSKDEIDLSKPVLYNNCANPITLSYINQNIKNDYTITDTSTPITYDGSLLKKCGIILNSIKSNFSFDIYITNNLDQEFKCTVYMDIPLEDANSSIYNGSITSRQDTNYKFYRYK